MLKARHAIQLGHQRTNLVSTPEYEYKLLNHNHQQEKENKWLEEKQSA